MEGELKCPVCRNLYTNPVLLSCSHSLCLTCAVGIQTSAHSIQANPEDVNSAVTDYDGDDIDEVSLLSETDSGVVCNSRPNSYVGTTSVGNIFNLTSLPEKALAICCCKCKKHTYVGEQGAGSLPRNRVLENIVDKYTENKQYATPCQMCEVEPRAASTEMCEQCEVFYCDECRSSCHPARGPLGKHNMVSPSEGRALLRAKHSRAELKCDEHPDESQSMYCTMCHMTVCYVCAHEGRHLNHGVQALGATSKAQKSELSQSLQLLSEKARCGTEFMPRLKAMADSVQANSVEFEARVDSQFDALVSAINRRRQQLLETLRSERERKERVLRQQVADYTAHLQRTTGLLQFSIEVLKEAQPSAFLQVSAPLVQRVCTAEETFTKHVECEPRVSPEFELCLDDHALLQAIKTLNFFQMKAPRSPQIVADECSTENNTVTICWRPHTDSVVDGYKLEIDDANEGHFKEVYRGKETICTVEGLHFNSMYQVRVRAFNHAGDSEYSHCVCLQTAETAWFHLEPTTSPSILFTNHNLTMTSNSYDDQVILGSVGFSKGVHYWEFSIDRYDNTPDPAFGVARFDVTRDKMIGRDDKGWGMYIDCKRSWLMHAAEHRDRHDIGIHQGSVVGVLLDLQRHLLAFYVDGEPRGEAAFVGLHGVFYPAISLNRHVQVTLHPGLQPPLDDSSDDG